MIFDIFRTNLLELSSAYSQNVHTQKLNCLTYWGTSFELFVLSLRMITFPCLSTVLKGVVRNILSKFLTLRDFPQFPSCYGNSTPVFGKSNQLQPKLSLLIRFYSVII